jgi:hypothetical protein
MGMKPAPYELRNTLPAPAPDDALVGALLAFANGREIVIWGQERPLEQIRAWSLWRTDPSEDERAAHVAFLHGLIGDPWGGLGHVTDKAGRRRPTNAVIRLPDLGSAARRADIALLPNRDFAAWLAHMKESMEREIVLAAHPSGYSLADFRSFKNIASAISFAMLLVMDQKKPYAKALCRCKLPTCQRFYLAQKNLKGGPPNRTYCEPKHRDEHHNSANRKKGLPSVLAV